MQLAYIFCGQGNLNIFVLKFMFLYLYFMQVGNSLMDDFHDHYGIFQFMWTTGLISDQTYRLLNVFCDFQSFVHTSPQCEKILDIAGAEAGNIDSYSIFTPTCHASFAASKNKVMKRLHVCFWALKFKPNYIITVGIFTLYLCIFFTLIAYASLTNLHDYHPPNIYK
jgi:hypothetical protein